MIDFETTEPPSSLDQEMWDVWSADVRARATFTLVVLVAAAAGLTWHSLASSRNTTFEIRTRDPVSGLIADSPVEFHGVEIGKVREVRLIDRQSVSILLSVKRDAPVTRATVATITTRGLAARGFTGYVYVALDDVGGDTRPLTRVPTSPFPVIPTAPPRSASLDTTISDVRHDVQLLTNLLQSVLDQKTVASLKLTLGNLQKVTRTFSANNARLEATISNAERASANAEQASHQIRPLLDSSRDTVRALQTQVLPQAHDTLAKLQKLSASMQEITTEIEADPSVLVRGRGKPAPGPGEKQ
jgi:phospholipid/cholesterol/gamma-HCH transport system substrate-binding protein